MITICVSFILKNCSRWNETRWSRGIRTPPSLSSDGAWLSLHSWHPMVNSLPRRPTAFQLSFSPLTHPSPSPRRTSVCACVELVSFLYRLLSCHPRPSGQHRASERHHCLTDQPANGQTVGRSLFRCHRGRPERAVQCVVCE